MKKLLLIGAAALMALGLRAQPTQNQKAVVYTQFASKEAASMAVADILAAEGFEITTEKKTKVVAYMGEGGGHRPQEGGPRPDMSSGRGPGMGGPGGQGMGGPGGPGMGSGKGPGMGGPGGQGMAPEDRDNADRPFVKAKIGRKHGQIVITLTTNKQKKNDTRPAGVPLLRIAERIPHTAIDVKNK